jgi:hypothetical protein
MDWIKVLPDFSMDVGGCGEEATAAVEAATRLLIAVSTFVNACSTLANTWFVRLSSMLLWFFC